jgi:hypothetical protein
MAVAGIDYDGGGYIDWDDNGEPIGERFPIVYNGVYLSTQHDNFTFNSGNFIVDWYNLNKKFYNELVDSEGFLSFSSSVNHFIMDGAPYDSAYLHFENDLAVLKYLDENWATGLGNMVKAREIYEGGSELFVMEGWKPTFEELKQYVKDYEIQKG